MAWADLNADQRAMYRKSLARRLSAMAPAIEVVYDENGTMIGTLPIADKPFVDIVSRAAKGAGLTYDPTTGAFTDDGTPLP